MFYGFSFLLFCLFTFVIGLTCKSVKEAILINAIGAASSWAGILVYQYFNGGEILMIRVSNLFGISNSAKIGGKIGWIKESQLSEKILNSIKKTNIGSITEEIEVAAGYLILQINDKREIQGNLEIKKELKNLIEFEKNRQLNLYSLLYYKRLKQNASINEYR